MKAAKSKVTSKFQTTVPREVRELLLLQKGDEVVFEIENGQVTLRKLTPMDPEYLFSLESSLAEWSGDHDEEAYKKL